MANDMANHPLADQRTTWWQSARVRRISYLLIPLLILVVGALAAKLGLKVVALLVIAWCGIAVLARPDLATLLVVALMYANVPAVASKFHGAPFVAVAAVPMLLCIPIAYYIAIRRESIYVPQVLWALCIFVLIQLVGSLLAVQPDLSVQRTIQEGIFEGLILFFLYVNAVRSPKLLRQIVWVLLAVGALLAGLGLFQTLTGTYDSNYGGFAQINRAVNERMTADPTFVPTRQPRLAGPFGVEPRFALVLLMLVPLGLFQFLSEKQAVLKYAALAATGMIAVGIALTQSRGPLVAFGLVIMLMVSKRYIRLKHVAIVALVMSMIILMSPSYRDRLVRLVDIGGLFAQDVRTSTVAEHTSIMGRANEAVTGIMVFMDHPILGAGHSMFPVLYEEYSSAAGFRQHEGKRASHNFYLDLAAEHGILGLSCMLVILVSILRRLEFVRKKFQVSDPQRSNMAAAFFLSIVAFMAIGFFGSFAYVRYFWFILAMATAASRLDFPESEQPPASDGGGRAHLTDETLE